MKTFRHISCEPVSRLERINTESLQYEGSRFYRIPGTPDWVPSVTTVTGHAKKEFFEEWQKKPGNKAHLKAACERGNVIHDAIEQLLSNDETYLKDMHRTHRDVINTMMPYLRKIDNILGLELPLWSAKIGIAGRADCIAEYEGVLSMIDFKGSYTPKAEDWVQNYFEQATCYAILFQELTGIQINQLVIIIGCENGITQVFKKPIYDIVPQLVQTIKTFKKSFPEYSNEVIEREYLKNAAMA